MPFVLGVIPARYASTRFPGKVLAPLGDRTMVEQVWRRASAAGRLDRVVVATDDRRVFETAHGFGAEALMTSPDHTSGTDRVAEVAERLGGNADLVINIQGDEPLLTATSVDRLVEAFDGTPRPAMATLSEPIRSDDELFDPNVVKVVVAADGRALYFSRSPIPYHRGAAERLETDFRSQLVGRPGGLAGYRRHQGIYAYTRDTLLALTRQEAAPPELDEGLEQLRALYFGYSIQVVDSDFCSMSVDTPADLKRAARQMKEANP